MLDRTQPRIFTFKDITGMNPGAYVNKIADQILIESGYYWIIIKNTVIEKLPLANWIYEPFKTAAERKKSFI